LQRLDAFLAQSGDHSAQWWSAAAVAAELERLLGRFEAVEARLAKLWVDAATASAGQRNAIEQIRRHAGNRNSDPQVLIVSRNAP
jgi:hypothetical protein